MSSSAIRAGKAFVEIGAKTDLFEKAITAVQAKMKYLAASAVKIGQSTMRVGAAVAGIGSAGLVAMVGLTKRFADAGGAIDDMAQRTGLAAEEVGGLSYAAQMSGTSIESVEAAIKKMQKSGAGAGKGTMADFLELAGSIAAIEDPSQRAAKAMEIFGKSGADLLPMLADGGDGIRRMIAEAESLGLVMSGADVQAAASLGDAMDRLWKVFDAVSNTIGAAFAPTLQSAIEYVTSAAKVVRQFVDDHREWVVFAAKVAAVVGVAGAALVAFGAAVAGAGMAMAGLVAAGTATVAVISAILSPVGLLIGGVVALGAAILFYSGAGATALSFLQGKWQELMDFVMPIIEGIKSALIQGKWGEAGQIAMLALEIAFRAGMRPLYSLWTDFQTWMVTSTVDAVTGVANVFASIPTALMNGFSTAITWLTGAWDSTVNYIAKKLLYLYSLFDESINYEAAAKQMDTEAAQRASARQTALDAATSQRSQDLTKGNAGRSAYADGLNSNVREDAAARKSEFDAQSASLVLQMASLIEAVGKPSVAPSQTGRQGTLNDLLGMLPGAEILKQAYAIGKTAIDGMPGMESQTATSGGTAGTFSGFAAGMVGSQSPLSKLADTSKKQLDTLQRIAKNTESGADSLEFDS